MVYYHERINIFRTPSSFYSALLDLYGKIISTSKYVTYGHPNIMTFQVFYQIF